MYVFVSSSQLKYLTNVSFYILFFFFLFCFCCNWAIFAIILLFCCCCWSLIGVCVRERISDVLFSLSHNTHINTLTLELTNRPTIYVDVSPFSLYDSNKLFWICFCFHTHSLVSLYLFTIVYLSRFVSIWKWIRINSILFLLEAATANV